MGFMDKVKSAASDAAAQAKVATGQAQAKIEATQLQSKLDGLAKQLGYAVYNEKAHGGPATGNDALIEEMKSIATQIEAAKASASTPGTAPSAGTPQSAPVTHTDAAPPAPSTSASEPTAGDFKL